MIARLKRRAQFLAVAKGRRHSTDCLTVQSAASGDEALPPRIGLTVTKKIGNAVERNRIRRRLKGVLSVEAGALIDGGVLKPGTDYVIVARRPAIERSFAKLTADLTSAFAGVHRLRSSAKAPRRQG